MDFNVIVNTVTEPRQSVHIEQQVWQRNNMNYQLSNRTRDKGDRQVVNATATVWFWVKQITCDVEKGLITKWAVLRLSTTVAYVRQKKSSVRSPEYPLLSLGAYCNPLNECKSKRGGVSLETSSLLQWIQGLAMRNCLTGHFRSLLGWASPTACPTFCLCTNLVGHSKFLRYFSRRTIRFSEVTISLRRCQHPFAKSRRSIRPNSF